MEFEQILDKEIDDFYKSVPKKELTSDFARKIDCGPRQIALRAMVKVAAEFVDVAVRHDLLRQAREIIVRLTKEQPDQYASSDAYHFINNELAEYGPKEERSDFLPGGPKEQQSGATEP